jgi:broad specificity phosphatase PhoE
MKKRVYLVRHGETDWNLESRMQGTNDIPLNHTGEAQASALAAALSGLEVEVIFSSPMKRAAKTAKILSRQWNVPVIFNANLREKNFGEAEGLLRDEMIEKYREHIVFNGASIDWAKSCIPGGESEDEHTSRLRKALNEIFSDPTYNHVMIVTHGGNMHFFTNLAGTKNCACFSAVYETDSGNLSDIKRIFDGANQDNE